MVTLAPNSGNCAVLETPMIPRHRSEELLHAVRGGDSIACRAFIEEHMPRMTAVARRFFRCEHECADVVQEAFVSVLRSLHSFEGGASISTWLHRIVVNVCLMKIRAQSRRTQVSLDNLLPAFDEKGGHLHPVHRWSEEPLHAVGTRELRERVRESIDQLPDGYREVLILRDIEEMDTEETARTLGISVANVKVRLHRARQAVRTLLEPYVAPASPGTCMEAA